MLEKEPVAGLASSSANQAIALEETYGLRELLVQLVDERLRAVHAGLAEAAVSDQGKKEDGIGPLDRARRPRQWPRAARSYGDAGRIRPRVEWYPQPERHPDCESQLRP